MQAVIYAQEDPVRIVSSAALMLCMALATSTLAQTPELYAQTRQDHPGIDEAVADMPNSDFHGTANRLSALWNRGPIRDLATGQGSQLPANFVKNLEATLVDLRDDLREDDLASLTDQQVLYILQVIEVYAFQRTLDLNGSIPYCTIPTPCGGGEGQPNCSCINTFTPVNTSLDQIVSIVRSVYGRARTAAGNPAGAVAPSALNGNNLGTSLPPLLSVLGVESIDS